MMTQDARRPSTGRRLRKRLATRQSISDVATRLFFERGFDQVTIDEIADAADVGRMTVFNHFTRKEDLFFDREQEVQDIAVEAVRGRAHGVSPIDALSSLAHGLIQEPFSSMPRMREIQRFAEVALASEALKARARQMRDAFIAVLAEAFAVAVDRPLTDPNASLAAGLIVATWSAAFAQAHIAFTRTGDEGEAHRIFLALIDRGIVGTKAALAGTPFV